MNLVPCPHCQQWIEIVELNCRIFRCGIFISNGQQIPPHASKEDCDRWAQGEIYGCGKPFRVDPCADGSYCAMVCDYI